MTPEIVSSPAPLEPGAPAGLDRAAARSAFAAASGPYTLRPRNSERAPGDPTALAAALLQERHVTLELQRAILPLHEAPFDLPGHPGHAWVAPTETSPYGFSLGVSYPHLAPEEAAYNITLALRLDGPLDVRAYRRAVADRPGLQGFAEGHPAGRPGRADDPGRGREGRADR